MGDPSDISKLLRLKRYEQPPPGYFEDFLHEFQRRQRAELLRRPAWEVLWDRLLSVAPTFRVPQFAYATIVAVAIGAAVLIVNQQPSGSGVVASARTEAAPSALSLTPARPVTIGDTLPAAARAGNSLPSHYVLQPRPVSNERPLSF